MTRALTEIDLDAAYTPGSSYCYSMRRQARIRLTPVWLDPQRQVLYPDPVPQQRDDGGYFWLGGAISVAIGGACALALAPVIVIFCSSLLTSHGWGTLLWLGTFGFLAVQLGRWLLKPGAPPSLDVVAPLLVRGTPPEDVAARSTGRRTSLDDEG